MAKNRIHISDLDASKDFDSVLKRVSDGDEVVIEHDSRPVAVIRSPDVSNGRLLSESIAMAKRHGSAATLDGDFAKDLNEIIEGHREPLNPPAWD